MDNWHFPIILSPTMSENEIALVEPLITAQGDDIEYREDADGITIRHIRKFDLLGIAVKIKNVKWED